MKKATTNISVLDVDFDVIYWYSHGRKGDYYNPPEPPEVEIEDVLLDGWIVTSLLSDWTLNQILDKIEIPSKYEEAEDYTDYLRDVKRDDTLTEGD